jgi:hypothetical protein
MNGRAVSQYQIPPREVVGDITALPERTSGEQAGCWASGAATYSEPPPAIPTAPPSTPHYAPAAAPFSRRYSRRTCAAKSSMDPPADQFRQIESIVNFPSIR